MIGVRLTRNPATVPYYKILSYLHKFRVLMHFFNILFQLFQSKFFHFHRNIKQNLLYKPFAQKEDFNSITKNPTTIEH